MKTQLLRLRAFFPPSSRPSSSPPPSDGGAPITAAGFLISGQNSNLPPLEQLIATAARLCRSSARIEQSDVPAGKIKKPKTTCVGSCRSCFTSPGARLVKRCREGSRPRFSGAPNGSVFWGRQGGVDPAVL